MNLVIIEIPDLVYWGPVFVRRQPVRSNIGKTNDVPLQRSDTTYWFNNEDDPRAARVPALSIGQTVQDAQPTAYQFSGRGTLWRGAHHGQRHARRLPARGL
jgi:hypothetical protein